MECVPLGNGPEAGLQTGLVIIQNQFQVLPYSNILPRDPSHNKVHTLFQNGLLEEDDLDAFINKINSYLNIEKDSKRFYRLLDVKNSFWDCIKDQLIREYKGAFMVQMKHRELLSNLAGISG